MLSDFAFHTERRTQAECKALLKAQAMGVDGGRLLVNAGRVPAAALETAVREGDIPLPGGK